MKKIDPFGRNMNLGFDDSMLEACKCTAGHPRPGRSARGSGSCYYCGCYCASGAANRAANSKAASVKNTH